MTVLSIRHVRTAILASSILLVGGVALAGCAAASDSPASTSTASASDAQQQARQPSGVSGLIASAQDGVLQVQSSDEQTTVRYSGTTTVTRTVAVDASTISVGSCVTIATDDDGATATTVTVTDAAEDGTCSLGIGGGSGGGDGGGQAPSGGARPSGAPTDVPNDAPDGSSDAQDGPGGAGGFGGFVAGSVTAVGDGTLTVESTGFGTDAETTSSDITLTADTTITGRVAATTADVVTGLCATAMGHADDAGGYDATSLALSDADENGECSTGFGPGGGRMPGAAGDAGQGDSE